MFIARDINKASGRVVYKVLESYRESGKVHKRHIAFLGKYPTVTEAYQAALKDSLSASDKLERLEYYSLQMQQKGA